MNTIKKILFIIISIACAAPLRALPVRGLRNVGNSCFINATLQCLSHLDGITQNILSQKKDYYQPKSLAVRYQKFLMEFNNEYSIDSKRAEKHLRKFCSQSWETLGVRKYSQQDAAELIDVFFNHVADYDIQEAVKDTLSFYPGTYQPQTALSDLFFSCANSTLIPLGLFSAPSIKTEPVSMLTLPFISKATTLEDCLTAHFMPTKLTGKEKVHYLPRIRIDALKRLALKHTSRYLVIRLNRNRFTIEPDKKLNKVNFVFTKLSEPISFPLINLDLSAYFDLGCEQENCNYKLVSFIVHVGNSALSGHYTAYVKKDNKWYYCDDESIVKITDDHIQKIAQRGYAIDPLHLLSPKQYAQEDIKNSKRQTPVLFFYEKEPILIDTLQATQPADSTLDQEQSEKSGMPTSTDIQKVSLKNMNMLKQKFQ